MTTTELERYESQWGDSVYLDRLAARNQSRPRRRAVCFSAQKRRADIPRGISARGNARNTYRSFA